MEIALAAYTKLVALAAADGEISDQERALLARYREGLGLAEDAVPLSTDARATPVLVPAELQQSSPAERAQIVRMLAKVGLVDGPLDPRERRRIESVASELGIGRTQLAGILVEVEQLVHSGGSRLRERRMWIGLGALALVLGVALVGPFEDEALVREGTAESPDARAVFRELEAEFTPSVLLVRTLYTLRFLGDARSWEGFGSAFFVTPDGLLVTCKHVVEPWKWNADAAQLIDEGWEVDVHSVRIAAWPAGSNLRSAEGERQEYDYSSAWDSRRGELEVVALPADHMERRRARLRDGSLWTGPMHANDDADLALLRARVDAPVHVLPLRAPELALSKFDAVMVLGYPEGAAPIEGRRLDTSPSLGEVRKVQATVQLTAPIVHGNSGGPVLDLEGRVIGVAARTYGDSSMGACIQVRALLPLLPEAGELGRSARAHAAAGELVAARAAFELAALRLGPGERRDQIERALAELGDE